MKFWDLSKSKSMSPFAFSLFLAFGTNILTPYKAQASAEEYTEIQITQLNTDNSLASLLAGKDMIEGSKAITPNSVVKLQNGNIVPILNYVIFKLPPSTKKSSIVGHIA